MGMTRQFEKPDYDGILKTTIQVGEALPEDHLARFVVRVVSVLELGPIYGRYANVGGKAIAPEGLLGVLVYGYANGVFRSRRIERETYENLAFRVVAGRRETGQHHVTEPYENLAFRFVAGGLQPDHDTIANFRKTFLGEIEALFVQVLLLAQEVGVLKLGNISLDGSKIHADASKSKAVSYKRLLELEERLRAEVHELLRLGESADQGEIVLPGGLVIEDEITRRQLRLENLAQAKAVLEVRAKERYEAEQAEYEAKLREREEKAKQNKRRPGGKPPEPPQPGPRDKDQYNFTDPDSRIMKNSTDDGFDRHYNVQVAVDQSTLLIVAPTLSSHPNAPGEAEPTLAALAPQLGQVTGTALDNGYFSPSTIDACERRGLWAHIAPRREAPHQPPPVRFAPT